MDRKKNNQGQRMSIADTPFSLRGKSVLVAGGAGYLGAHVCKITAELGAKVCIADLNVERMQKVVADINAEHPDTQIIGMPLDAGDEQSIIDCVDAAVAQFGELDGLVNATFGSTSKKLDDLTAEDFDRANRINLTGSFLLARKAAQHMSGIGSIVMYASMYGVVAPNPANYPAELTPNPIEYGAGKAGMIQMVRYLAAHYGPRNIRVNGVAPGPYPNLNTTGWNKEFVENLKRETMLGRTGEAHETAGATAFLLSGAASYITGQIISIDGGWTAW